MKAGRLDIACLFVIHSFFISNARREVHPKHIEIRNEVSISKKDVADIIRKALFKYKKGKKIEVLPGIFIEKKSLIEFLEGKSKEKKIYLPDPQKSLPLRKKEE
jgi:tRNA pseudouridine-54 N-methylase